MSDPCTWNRWWYLSVPNMILAPETVDGTKVSGIWSLYLKPLMVPKCPEYDPCTWNRWWYQSVRNMILVPETVDGTKVSGIWSLHLKPLMVPKCPESLYLKPLMVPKCPECQIWKVALNTFVFFNFSSWVWVLRSWESRLLNKVIN